MLSQMLGHPLDQRKSEILLAAVILSRSTSFILSKTALRTLDPFNLLALRFLTAFLFLSLLFGKKLIHIRLRELKYGILLGILYTFMMGCELLGLRATDSATTSFIENSAMIFVPILQIVIYKKHTAMIENLRIILAIIGIGMLTIGAGGGTFNRGCFFLFGSALFYASAILTTNHVSRKGDPLLIGIIQVFTIGILSLGLSLVIEQPRLPKDPIELGVVLALAVICSGFGFTLQPVAQRGISAERAGMMCALSPLSASLQGSFILREQITPEKLIGCILILLSLLLAMFRKSPRKPRISKPVILHNA